MNMVPPRQPNETALDEGQAESPAGSVPASAPAAAPVSGSMAFDDVVSGAFDAVQEQDLPLPSKRVLQPEADSPKLHKVLAQAGLGSRLEMEQLILEGRISVNGEPAHIGQRIQYGDTIKVNGKPVRYRLELPFPRFESTHDVIELVPAR